MAYIEIPCTTIKNRANMKISLALDHVFESTHGRIECHIE